MSRVLPEVVDSPDAGDGEEGAPGLGRAHPGWRGLHITSAKVLIVPN